MYTRNSILCGLGLGLITASVQAATGGTSFNPDISLIIDGRYGNYANDGDYELPGFMLGGEASRGERGYHLGHNELVMSANIDDMYYGKITTAIADHDGTTEVELEEAFIETLGLGYGFTVRAGRFYSGIGYLNSQHGHAWDFTDAPLVYRGLFGNQIADDGVQVSWLAPTDLYLKFGVEGTRGGRYPSGGAANKGQGAQAVFIKLGGDVGVSHSWQFGLSQWRADVVGREAGGHDHGGTTETPSFTGDSTVNGVDFVWKWAPNGNASHHYVKLQAEYFEREEDGKVEMKDSDPLESTDYKGKQTGWYAQLVYQFIPRWRVGLRYDELSSDNTGSDADVLAEAGLTSDGHTPKRSTVMLDYSRSEYSRIRVQYARDDSYEESDNIVFVQYIMSLGAHGAHKY